MARKPSSHRTAASAHTCCSCVCLVLLCVHCHRWSAGRWTFPASSKIFKKVYAVIGENSKKTMSQNSNIRYNPVTGAAKVNKCTQRASFPGGRTLSCVVVLPGGSCLVFRSVVILTRKCCQGETVVLKCGKCGATFPWQLHSLVITTKPHGKGSGIDWAGLVP